MTSAGTTNLNQVVFPLTVHELIHNYTHDYTWKWETLRRKINVLD